MSGYNVVSASGDHTAKLWDTSALLLHTGTKIIDAEGSQEPLMRTYTGHSGGLSCMQFNLETRTLLTGSSDKTIRNWDLETGATVSVLYGSSPIENRADEPYANEVSFLSSPDWSVTDSSHTLIQRPQGGHVGSLHFLGHALAAGYGDGLIRLFDLRSGQCHRTFVGHLGTVTTVTFDDNEIISGSLDKTIKVSVLVM